MRIFLTGLLLTLVMPVWSAEIKIDFGDTTSDLAPTNFHGVLAGSGQPGVWTLLSDAVPPLLAPLTDQAPVTTRRYVLAQTSQDPTDERFPIFVYDGNIFRDFKASTRFKIVSGISEQMAGLVFRYQNASNFYVVRASALGHNVRFYKMVNGGRSEPIGTPLDITIGTWHTLTVQCTGNQITIWLDDKAVMPPLGDNTFNTGKIGFWTKSDAVSYFSDLDIDYTPLIPAAQTLVNSILHQQSRLLGLRIYALDKQGQPCVLASNVATEVGNPGGAPEKAAILEGTVAFGTEPGTVAVLLPFRDRNGDPMASVKVRMKSFLGETQEHAITRATTIIKLMQAQISTKDDLYK